MILLKGVNDPCSHTQMNRQKEEKHLNKNNMQFKFIYDQNNTATLLLKFSVFVRVHVRNFLYAC